MLRREHTNLHVMVSVGEHMSPVFRYMISTGSNHLNHLHRHIVSMSKAMYKMLDKFRIAVAVYDHKAAPHTHMKILRRGGGGCTSARADTEHTLMKVPMMVCGREKRYTAPRYAAAACRPGPIASSNGNGRTLGGENSHGPSSVPISPSPDVQGELG